MVPWSLSRWASKFANWSQWKQIFATIKSVNLSLIRSPYAGKWWWLPTWSWKCARLRMSSASFKVNAYSEADSSHCERVYVPQFWVPGRMPVPLPIAPKKSATIVNMPQVVRLAMQLIALGWPMTAAFRCCDKACQGANAHAAKSSSYRHVPSQKRYGDKIAKIKKLTDCFVEIDASSSSHFWAQVQHM